MALEPGLRASAALVSPESGVFDSHGYMLALQGEIEDRRRRGGAGDAVRSAPRRSAGGGFEVRGRRRGASRR